MRLDPIEIRVVRVLGIIHVDSDDLVVLALLVPHAQHADRLGAQHAQRHHGLLTKYQHVQRIAIVAERAREKSVVRRIVDGRVEDAIEPEQTRRLVQLVLDLRSLRNLDDRAEMTLDMVPQLHVMPRVHGQHYTEATCHRHSSANESLRPRPHAVYPYGAIEWLARRGVEPQGGPDRGIERRGCPEPN